MPSITDKEREQNRREQERIEQIKRVRLGLSYTALVNINCIQDNREKEERIKAKEAQVRELIQMILAASGK